MKKWVIILILSSCAPSKRIEKMYIPKETKPKENVVTQKEKKGVVVYLIAIGIITAMFLE